MKRTRELLKLKQAGLRHYQARNLVEAASCFERAAALAPGDEEAWSNLGATLAAAGQLTRAGECYAKALKLNPHDAATWYNQGNLLSRQARHAEAANAYRRAVGLHPRFGAAWINLARALQALRQAPEAIDAYRRGLAIEPRQADALANLGNLYLAERDYAAALEVLEQAAAVGSPDWVARYNLATARMHLCDWRGVRELRTQLIDPLLSDRGQASRFPVVPHMLPVDVSPAEELYFAKLQAAMFVSRQKADAFSLVPAKRSAVDRRLRIGYVSSDVRDHATMHLMAGLFELHDRNRIVTHVYASGSDDGSALRRRVVSGADSFIDITSLDDAAAARRITQDGIDILIDLKGYTGDTRIGIFVYRPAPVQVTWLGYPATLGADFIDYVITDPILTPPELQTCFTEQFAYLPDTYQVTSHDLLEQRPTPTRAACGLPANGFVYCGFTNLYKIEPGIFSCWMRILQQVPGSVLWLYEGPLQARENLVREAAQRGVGSERLVFAPIRLKADHLARHRLADVFLDTYLLGGHTTASDALWAGVPVLTCPGRRMSGRVAASLLHAVDMPELIMPSLAVYEQAAVRLGHEPALVAVLKQKLQSKAASAPLFDRSRFVKNLEVLYAKLWQRHEAGLPPEMIRVG